MFRFESPWWFLALIVPVGLWAWRWWRRRRKAGVRFSSVSNARQAGRSWRQRLQWLPTALGDVALILLVVCLARPQAGNERVHDISEGIAIEMIVDRSGSMGQEMQYEGKEMTRLEVVKDVFQRFVYGDGKSLEGRPNDLIGIISFARYAETACYLWEQSQRSESPFIRTRYGTYAIKPDFAIQLDLFLDNAIRAEIHKEAAKPMPNPHHIQLELFT